MGQKNSCSKLFILYLHQILMDFTDFNFTR